MICDEDLRLRIHFTITIEFEDLPFRLTIYGDRGIYYLRCTLTIYGCDLLNVIVQVTGDCPVDDNLVKTYVAPQFGKNSSRRCVAI